MAAERLSMRMLREVLRLYLALGMATRAIARSCNLWSGGDKLHDYCAKHLPGNAFPGADVLVNGKRFDGLQPLPRILWEIKTDDFDNYKPIVKKFAIEKEVPELQRELRLAQACGFEFRIGVRSAAHKKALEDAAPELEPLIVIMDWC